MNLGRLVVAEFLGYVAGYSPVGILVNGCWDECGYVFACEFLVYEAWCGLNGWPKDPADVGAVLEAKGTSSGAVSDAFGNFQGKVVQQVDVLGVVDDEGVLRLKAQRNKIQCVFVRPLAWSF